MSARIVTYFLFSDTPGPGTGVSPQADQERTDCTPGEYQGRKILVHVKDLGYAWAHVILGVTLETPIPNAIGRESVR